MKVYVRDVVVDAGRHPEDGETAYRVRYLVLAENGRGDRLVYREDYASPADAARVARGIDPRGVVEGPDWSWTEPAYGSEAYEAYEPELVWRERNEEAR